MCLSSTTFWGALGGLLGLPRLPNDESRSTVNMQGWAPWLHTTSPLDTFLNFENLLYYFFGALGAPEDFPGISVLAALGALPSSLGGAHRRHGLEKGR